MEYAIGKVLFVSGNIARIQTLFYSDNGFWKHSGVEDHFPPAGKVFAPNFNSDYPSLKNDDIICFSYMENEIVSGREEDDKFIIPRQKEGGIVWKCPQIYNITPDDIFNRKSVSDTKELCFFFCKQGATSYICGPVWSSDLSPKTGKEVKAWKYRSNYDTITDPESGAVYLAVKMDEFTKKDSSIEIDCMTSTQLKEWLKGKLVDSLPPEVLKQVKIKVKELASKAEIDPLTKERFERVRNSLNAISFDWNELQSIRTLPGFKDVIDSCVQTNIEAVMATERAMLNARRQEIEDERKNYEQDWVNARKNHDDEKKRLTAELGKIAEQVKSQQQQLIVQTERFQKLQANRENLIDSIKIQAEILGINQSQHSAYSGYPLEYVRRHPKAEEVTLKQKEKFCDRVNESLERQRGFMRKSLALLQTELSFLTKDIRTGIFLANVLGNSTYQLCQPSPRWISFKEFWEESLQNIWDSAHTNPEIWHFLLLENFNIALPECYGMPLWNIITQKTKKIPYASTSEYPANLRIIVSKTAIESEDNSHMGLQTHIADSWQKLDPSESWDENDNWEQFAEDMDNGLVVNEEYFYPVNQY